MRRRNGFTLIELLVVIAIIAILAAILLPVFARARENARKSTCQNNLKQITTAIMQYTQDYDEKWPYGAWNGGTNTLGNHWMVSTAPYLKSESVWVCPSAAKQVATGGYASGSWGVWWSQGWCQKSYYAWNEDCQNVMSSSQCNNPSSTYLLMDKGNDQCFTSWWDWNGRAAMTLNGSNQAVAGPHLDGKNVAFVDGHVKWMTPTQMKSRDMDRNQANCSPYYDAASPYYARVSN